MQLTRGRVFENDVLKELDLEKNTKSIPGGSIPDSMTGGRITEIKDQKYIYRSTQFKNYLKTGEPVDLVVSPTSRVSVPLYDAIIDSHGTVMVRTGVDQYVPYYPWTLGSLNGGGS